MKYWCLFFLLSLLLLYESRVEAAETVQVEYSLVTATAPDCASHAAERLRDPYAVRVQHRMTCENTSGEWSPLTEPEEKSCEEAPSNTSINGVHDTVTIRVCKYTLSVPEEMSDCMQLRLVQLTHRGGFCDCWAVAFPKRVRFFNYAGLPGYVYYNNLTAYLGEFRVSVVHPSLHAYNTVNFNFRGTCLGSASLPRLIPFDMATTKIDSKLAAEANFVDKKLSITESEYPKTGDICTPLPHVQISFDLNFEKTGSGALNAFEEGVELAFRVHPTTEWVPLSFYTSRNSINENIKVGTINHATSSIQIRGFNVPFSLGYVHNVTFKMCDGIFARREFNASCLQFRWLQTVRQRNVRDADTVNVDNIVITHNSFESPQHQVTLLLDNFSGSNINHAKWITRRVLLENNLVQFDAYPISFTPIQVSEGHSMDHTIISRELSTVCLRSILPSPRLSYILTTANAHDCFHPTPNAFTSPIQFQYRLNSSTNWITFKSHKESELFNYNTTMMAHIQMARYIVELDKTFVDHFTAKDFIQFQFIQVEHRGGFCNCWSISNLKVIDWAQSEFRELFKQLGKCDTTSSIVDIYLSDSENPSMLTNLSDFKSELCLGSSSQPRGFNLLHYPDSNFTVCDSDPVITDAHQVVPNNCNTAKLIVEVAFDLNFFPGRSNGACDAVDTFHEGVELAYRIAKDATTSTWTPLMYFTATTILSDVSGMQSPISLTKNVVNITTGTVLLRGYHVPYVIQNGERYTVRLCRDVNQPLEFRWLQTSLDVHKGISDVVALDNITISVHNATHSATLFQDDFANSTSIDLDMLTDNVHLTSECIPDTGGALFFYDETITFLNTNYTISSRQFQLGPFYPENATLIVDTIPSVSEKEILSSIQGDENLAAIFNLIKDQPAQALGLLDDLLTTSASGNDSSTVNDDKLTAATYLFSSIQNQFDSSRVDSAVSKTFLSVADGLVRTSQRNSKREMDDISKEEDLAGSTLLQVLDNFALNNYEPGNAKQSGNQMKSNIVIQVHDKFIETPIMEEDAEIKLPEEIIQGSNKNVRIASFVFRNMSGVLPERINQTDGGSNTTDVRLVTHLASPVVSASFLCDGCMTSNLTQDVQVTFTLSDYDQDLLNNDPESEVKCVFWKFDNIERPGAVLYSGQWSQDGCETKLISNKTICSCNHLTHFAIILSAKPANLSDQHSLALGIIGKVGVAISLVAMTMTVVIFIILNRSIKRPLYNMRNYIHIQLCITLGIAQIIFVAGIEPNLKEGKQVGGVPVGCRLVAVLLHYWFLVSFMWMLMEGVVLYVALVRVFVKHHGRYITAFTVASYGAPLLYVGGLGVPLGFARNDGMRYNQTYDYGYKEACYLNPATSFIWSLIAPVILIFLANVGFFILAIVILSKHQRRKDTKSKAKNVRNWLKACISLSVVMGMTWIIGVVVIENPVPELTKALAYVFTFCVAFQGLFIFIIFVILSESKRLRELHAKWWKSRVAESEFLSKHFGDRSFTTTYTMSTQQVSVSQFAITEKDLLAQSQDTHNVENKEPPSEENQGTFFDVVYIQTEETKVDVTHTDDDGNKYVILEDMLVPHSQGHTSASSCEDMEDTSDLCKSSLDDKPTPVTSSDTGKKEIPPSSVYPADAAMSCNGSCLNADHVTESIVANSSATEGPASSTM